MCILLLPERQLPVPLDKGNEGSEDEITKAVEIKLTAHEHRVTDV